MVQGGFDFFGVFRHDAHMVAVSKIHACVREVAEKFHPSRIILFGSYAYGKPTDDSDIDLLVVMNHKGCAVEQAATIRSSLRSTFPIDVLVRSPRKIRERLKMGDPFFLTVIEKEISICLARTMPIRAV